MPDRDSPLSLEELSAAGGATVGGAAAAPAVSVVVDGEGDGDGFISPLVAGAGAGVIRGAAGQPGAGSGATCTGAWGEAQRGGCARAGEASPIMLAPASHAHSRSYLAGHKR